MISLPRIISSIPVVGVDGAAHHLGWADGGEPAAEQRGGLRSSVTYVPGLRHRVRFNQARRLGRHLNEAVTISASGYTEAAIVMCRDELQRCVFVVAELRELVMWLERQDPVAEMLRQKVRAATIDKRPLLLLA